MQKKIFIKTFGCQMNEYDSNRIYHSVKNIGFEKTFDQKNADCYILNTCHIRDKAKEKVYHEIGRVKKMYRTKKKPIIVVAGCVAQAENQEMIKREPYIDLVIGPQSYHKINDSIKSITIKKKIEETDFDVESKFSFFDKIENKSNKISAFLTIQEGCDKFCNFCVVPFTRGPEYSRPFNTILNEAETLIKSGVKEIILLGQNVNAYSYNQNSKEYRLSNILNELAKYSELKRIRYTTSHPKDMTDDLIDCYKINKKLMPFIHLPIQSGSNKILKLMNRKHTVEEYIQVYNRLRKINKEIEFSSDFIVSYPGETEKDFEETLTLVKKINFINSYSFIFSPRPGTNAAKLKQLDPKVSKERLQEIQKYLFDHQRKKNKLFEGKIIDVLVENRMEGQKYLFGRNKYMNSVIINADEKHLGDIVNVKIDKSNQNTLFGTIKYNNIRAA
tara:strand:+ start:40 stop:1374 length:1335 start_codon:yes stop_codon:yes gene_type:complete